MPIVTTVLTVPFGLEILGRYRRHPDRLHLLWWALGIFTYGVGTLTESLTTLVGWREPVFRAWYISGALLGGEWGSRAFEVTEPSGFALTITSPAST